MNININGESRSFAEGSSIRDVLDHMGLLEKPVVVELNLEIVSKERWEGQRLKEGDQMEVIGFVGGGANHTGEAHLLWDLGHRDPFDRVLAAQDHLETVPIAGVVVFLEAFGTDRMMVVIHWSWNGLKEML